MFLPTPRRFRSSFFLLSFVFFAFLWAGCDSGSSGEGEEEEDTGRGSIVAATLMDSRTKDQLRADFPGVVLTNDVELYRILYRTIDADGNETTASGALFLPLNPTRTLAIVSYQHGTIVEKTEVVSVQGFASGEAGVGGIFGGSGYLAVMPDYLGLGSSSGLHPYIVAAPSASAVIDLVRAARRFAEDRSLTLNGQVFLTGYSEGGYATMAAYKEMQTNHAAEFNIAAVAPMAGPYDLSGTMVDVMLNDAPYDAPFFLPYIILAYDDVFNLFGNLSEVFVSPYNTTLPTLFDGTKSGGEIDAQLPSIPLQMLQPAFVDAFSNNASHPVRQALQQNDLYDWTPMAPTQLFHCTADELVPFANSQVAFDRFEQRGAPNVLLQPLNEGGHAECAPTALLLGKLWMDTFRTN